jgi:hypothetical protein
MEVDFVSLFFGTSIALFIALLAWGDFIRKPREELKDLESDYIKSLGRKNKKDILPLIRPYSTYTFTQQMSSVLGIWKDKRIGGEELELTKEIKRLHHLRKSLEFQYGFRYFGVVSSIIILFVLGVLSYLFPVYNGVYLSILFVIILILLVNSLMIYFKENNFVKDLFNTLDKTGA